MRFKLVNMFNLHMTFVHRVTLASRSSSAFLLIVVGSKKYNYVLLRTDLSVIPKDNEHYIPRFNKVFQPVYACVCSCELLVL